MSDGALITDFTKKELVAEKLAFSFGQGGDFTVAVTEVSSSQRTEFKVWAVILSSWSEVFEKMMCHDFEEKEKQEFVITEFSPKAVEAFLRFLYSGSLDATLDTLIEVIAIADKYQVPELYRHGHLPLAADMFHSADMFMRERGVV
eukprot:g5134.t1